MILENYGNATEHLAYESTFLSWVRTAIAITVFGFVGSSAMLSFGQSEKDVDCRKATDWMSECNEGTEQTKEIKKVACRQYGIIPALLSNV